MNDYKWKAVITRATAEMTKIIKTTVNPYINKFENVDEMHDFQKKKFTKLFQGKKALFTKKQNKTTQLNL